jgi:shikimate dehydrogenase
VTSAHRAAVLGSPVAHSLSPVLHRAAYAELGLEDWSYEAIEIGEDELAGFVTALDDTWAGLSLTMPLKRVGLEFAATASDTARLARGANTLVRLGDGWAAHNTDVDGLVNALAEAGVHTHEAVVLGAGATGESAVLALARSGVTRVTVAARRPDAAAEALHGVLESRAAAGAPLALETVPWAQAGGLLDAPLVVSTVPRGVPDDLASAVPAAPGALFDVLYDPWPTPLAAAWAARGSTVLGGLDLLVHQAVLQVLLMSGRSPQVATLRAAGLDALARRRSST